MDEMCHKNQWKLNWSNPQTWGDSRNKWAALESSKGKQLGQSEIQKMWCNRKAWEKTSCVVQWGDGPWRPSVTSHQKTPLPLSAASTRNEMLCIPHKLEEKQFGKMERWKEGFILKYWSFGRVCWGALQYLHHWTSPDKKSKTPVCWEWF